MKSNGLAVKALVLVGILVGFAVEAPRADAQIYLQMANAASTGTTVNKLAIATGAPSTALIASTGTTAGVLGIVAAGAGTTGNAIIAIDGELACAFDGSNVAGNWAVISTTTAGDCHDSGTASTSAPPTGTIGLSISTNSGAGAYTVKLGGAGLPSQASGGGGSTFTSSIASIGFPTTTAVTAQTATLPAIWTSGTITSVHSSTAGGGTFVFTINIGGTPVTGCTGITVSGTGDTVTTCTAANTFVSGNQISTVISSPSGTVNNAYVTPVATHTAN